MSENDKVFLGELLVKERVITPEHLKTALSQQEKRGGLLGMILVNLGYLSEENLMKYIRIQEDKNNPGGKTKSMKPLLGEMLTKDGKLTKAQVEKALEYQKKHGVKIGIAFLDLEFIDKATLVHYLAKQSQSVIDSIGISTVEAKHIVSEIERK